MSYNPYYESARSERAIRFSRLELQHLAIAVGALTIGFAYVRAPGGAFDIMTPTRAIIDRPLILVASFLAVASGFVLHELAHKIVAIRYGCLAEFRAQVSGLGMSILIAVMFKFLFAAPGAVHILGRVDARENGIISLVGPGTNFALALAMFPFTFAANPDASLPMVMTTIGSVNATLAVFNLLPVGGLDGRKVMAWSRPVWLASFIACVLLLILTVVPLVSA